MLHWVSMTSSVNLMLLVCKQEITLTYGENIQIILAIHWYRRFTLAWSTERIGWVVRNAPQSPRIVNLIRITGATIIGFAQRHISFLLFNRLFSNSTISQSSSGYCLVPQKRVSISICIIFVMITFSKRMIAKFGRGNFMHSKITWDLIPFIVH